MIYKASLDRTSKVVTVLISVLFFVIIAIQLSVYIEYRSWPSLATSVLLFAIYFLAYLFSPVNYRIERNKIVVHRPGSDITIPRNDVKRIELLAAQKLKGSIRTFGAGGLFGYFGQFMNSELGCMTWYATKHRKKVVLIELQNNKKIIITPDEPEQFIEQMQLAA